MLATLIPLFDHTMSVCAYSVFAQKENFLLNPRMLGVGRYDGASNIVGFEIIENMGLQSSKLRFFLRQKLSLFQPGLRIFR